MQLVKEVLRSTKLVAAEAQQVTISEAGKSFGVKATYFGTLIDFRLTFKPSALQVLPD